MNPIKIIIHKAESIKILVQDFPPFLRAKIKAVLKLRITNFPTTALSGVIKAGCKLLGVTTQVTSNKGTFEGETQLSTKGIPVSQSHGIINSQAAIRLSGFVTTVTQCFLKVGSIFQSKVESHCVIPYLNEERGPLTLEEVFADPEKNTVEKFLWKNID